MSEKALDRFIGAIGAIRDRLEELTAYADDHMGYNPDDINWGHVGTADYMLEKLTALTDLAYGRGEYAKSGPQAPAANDRPLAGSVSFASGETFRYTDADEYIKTVKEELPYRAASGFCFETLTDDPRVRKAIDDLIYNEYGEENPHGLESYSQTRRQEYDENDWEDEM
jgi:hypothetical protein